ncbi:YncE family protein [Sphingomicrobium flavum]|uniref:YncE family protein n=1 Tax=Sphingomicrobium flavum TaxID=1229164 RepID=UPI0021ADB479|nr:hypothetical protein [Sphingomicrobium flavum]
MKRACLFLCSAALATMPAGADTLIVGNKYEHSVSFIDLATGQEVVRSETGRAPHEIAVSPDGKTAVLVSYREQGYDGDTLHVFDVASGQKLRVIGLGDHRGPHGLKWIGDTDKVVVTTEVTQDIVVVDVETGELALSAKTDMQGSHMVALSPDLKRAYVANIGSGNFTVIDLATGAKLADVEVGAQAEAITATQDGDEIWVGANGARTVSIFDAHSYTLKHRFGVDGVPIRVEISPDGRHVAISLADKNMVEIYDSRSRERIATVDLGVRDLALPVTMLWSPDNRRLWVAATGSATIAEIDTQDWTIARTFAVGKGSDGLAYSPVDLQAPERAVTLPR